MGKFIADSEKAEALVRMKTGEVVEISATKKQFLESDLYKASLPGQSPLNFIGPNFAAERELLAQVRRKRKQEQSKEAFRF